MSPEEFDTHFQEALDAAVALMAQDPAIDLATFSGLTCFMENLAFFSPVVYGVISNAKKA